MLALALRTGATTVRRAGWRGWLLALASAALTLATSVVLLVLVVALFQQVLGLALIRLYASHRDERPFTVDAEDADLTTAVRRAAALGRPALRLAAMSVLFGLGAVITTLGIAAAAGVRTTDGVMEAEREFGYTAPVVAALLGAFIAVAEQRVALERDPRVLVACAHAFRVARTSFAAVFALNLLQAAVAVTETAVGGPRPSFLVQLAFVPAAAVALAFVISALTGVYLASPRLDVPDEWGRRAEKPPD